MTVESVVSNLASQISGAIQKAAQSTGISFQYLLTTAQIESGLNPQAQAPTSSAKGLYQFVDQTWLGTLKQDGPALGLGQYASAISQTAGGHYTVADPTMRTAIMKLRDDPSTSAMMAGALARNNATQLQASTGRAPSEGELYAAHFLGPDGAGKLINMAMSNPTANAATMFPSAAGANRSIFYRSDGSARSVGEVYARLTGKFNNTSIAMNTPAAQVSPAAAAAAALTPANDPPGIGPLALRSTLSPQATPVPDTAGVTQALADAREALPALQDTKPLFQAMFTDRARAAVTSTVAGLWTPDAPPASSATSQASTTSPAPASSSSPTSIATPLSGPVNPLELFTDGVTDVRRIFNGRG
jgi:hypothetical protein